ncbi:MAG: hypothetical protein K9H25_21925 [Rhodospirillum sp.]|nr:hypothetical protein [Rhodospirillum sp.]MCF8491713.1 hypothetical protein [Rhodospirillum sp.]
MKNEINAKGELITSWLFPVQSMEKALGCDFKAVGNDIEHLLSKIMNILGLPPKEDSDVDGRFMFFLDSRRMPKASVKRPTLFAGGAANCYISANEADGWGRTGRLDNENPGEACQVGVPEAICLLIDLNEAEDVTLAGILPASSYAKCGKPNPLKLADIRFGRDTSKRD